VREKRESMDEILEPQQVADMLKVHRRTLIRWAEQGKIPGFKIGDLWRFRREAIEEYIRKEEQRYAKLNPPARKED
jgi:excisionase family DNA binding protein